MEKLRFKGFNKTFNQKTIEQLIIKGGSGGTPTSTNKDYYNGNLPFLSITDLTNSNGYIYKTDKHITDLGLKNSSAWIVPKEAISLSMYASVGKVAILKTELATSQAFYNMVFSNLITRDYVFQYLKKMDLNDEWSRLVSTGTQSNLNALKVKNLSINIPKDEVEQEKIGGFLSSFDKLIQKQQDKIGSLKELKKGYLQQIFPEKGSNIPKIRFKGFADAWEQFNFKEIFDKLQNNSLSRADLNDENGNAMNVHYGDVLIKFSEILDVQNDNIPYITEPNVIEKYKNSFLQNGDIVIADAAEDNTVGKCCEIVGLTQETVLSGLHTIPCRPLKKFASGYLGYYMNSNVYHNQLLPLIQGSKISSISINTLANTSLVYPKSIDEQLLIANKFRALDNLITLHKHKLEELEEMKKGYMQRLFA